MSHAGRKKKLAAHSFANSPVLNRLLVPGRPGCGFAPYRAPHRSVLSDRKADPDVLEARCKDQRYGTV
jgi:hypothetical protein